MDKCRQIISESVLKCLNESFLNDEIRFEEKDNGEDIIINILKNEDIMGYAILIPHKKSSLYSEIADTDSYEMAEDVIYELSDKPIMEIAYISTEKVYRNKGISKKLIEYVLEKYQEYQFYLRVCPTDGVDENTFVNTFTNYDFIVVGGNDENGTFMIKK